MDIKIGQVWRDKDKRRGTVIEIIDIGDGSEEVLGLVVGTEEERWYKSDRLIKRWEMTKDAIDNEIDKLLDVPKAEAPAEPKYKTREQWLVAAIDLITKKIFKPNNFEVPAVRVSVGWPGGRGKKAGVQGQCFATGTTTDKTAQIFVSPAEASVPTVLAIVTHELVHAVDDCKSAHKSGFIKIAKEIGFLPKWTSSDNRSDALTEKLATIAEKLGPYPHAAIELTERPTVQKTYMLKVMCVEDDEFFVRMTQTKLDDFGAPLCPCHKKTMEVEEK